MAQERVCGQDCQGSWLSGEVKSRAVRSAKEALRVGLLEDPKDFPDRCGSQLGEVAGGFEAIVGVGRCLSLIFACLVVSVSQHTLMVVENWGVTDHPNPSSSSLPLRPGPLPRSGTQHAFSLSM